MALCTRPTDLAPLLSDQTKGEPLKPTSLSRHVRPKAEFTRFWSMGRDAVIAFLMAAAVISLVTTLVGFLTFSSRAKCQEIISPSRSGSVANKTSVADLTASFSSLSTFLPRSPRGINRQLTRSPSKSKPSASEPSLASSTT